MNQMLAPLKKYAVFEGRAARPEYWWFFLFLVIVYCVAAALDSLIFGHPLVFISLAVLALFLPHLGVAVRRLHDSNRSGWWMLLSLVPFGGLVVLVFMLLPGTPGENRFGPDPKTLPEPAPAVA
jgi:uncharacterized membrane protein YhaH (DUF805 family)